jgi:hypothetical protein
MPANLNLNFKARQQHQPPPPPLHNNHRQSVTASKESNDTVSASPVSSSPSLNQHNGNYHDEEEHQPHFTANAHNFVCNNLSQLAAKAQADKHEFQFLDNFLNNPALKDLIDVYTYILSVVYFIFIGISVAIPTD